MGKDTKTNSTTAAGKQGKPDSGSPASISSRSISTTGSDAGSTKGNQGDNPPAAKPVGGTKAVDPKSASSSSSSSSSSSRADSRANSGSGRDTGKRSSSSSSGGGTKREKEGSTENLEILLLAVHGGLAAAFDADEFLLTPAQTKELAAAMQRVSRLYTNVVLSPAQQAWGGLLFTMGCLYIPRYMNLIARKKTEAEESKKNSGTVVNIPPGVAEKVVN